MSEKKIKSYEFVRMKTKTTEDRMSPLISAVRVTAVILASLAGFCLSFCRSVRNVRGLQRENVATI
jgi:hypothetical protein